jgi:hypothetical protein
VPRHTGNPLDSGDADKLKAITAKMDRIIESSGSEADTQAIAEAVKTLTAVVAERVVRVGRQL